MFSGGPVLLNGNVKDTRPADDLLNLGAGIDLDVAVLIDSLDQSWQVIGQHFLKGEGNFLGNLLLEASSSASFSTSTT